jgi:uncharacterized protein (TIGR00290 family)
MKKTLFSWSSGKDSALALHTLRQNPEFEVTGLLTTLTEDYDRISMHGVRRALLEAQATSLDLPLEIVLITKNAGNEEYEDRMRRALTWQQGCGVEAVAFGDIFLADVRQYRETKLSELGLEAVFPLWEQDTHLLSSAFLAAGFRAIVTCVDTQALSAEFAGREIDARFLAELPEGVDPCGERGEYHSFVYDGPLLRQPVRFQVGEKTLREGRFYFCDLLPEISPVR